MAEVVKHASADDCWVVVNGKAYDLTRFSSEHPGGPEGKSSSICNSKTRLTVAIVIWKWAGKDGTETYNMYHDFGLIEKELPGSDKKGSLDESTITKTWLDAQKDQTTMTKADPNEKPPLSALINLDDFLLAFEKSGSPKGWAYIHGASNDLLSLNANRSWWGRIWFRPRIMRNVSTVNTKMVMLGAKVSMPVFISPMGIAKTAGPEGEAALGAGAAAGGIVHCMSTAASMSVEDILASVPVTYPYFFQLYVDKARHKTEALLKKLEGMKQIKALFVTVDLPVVSKREADERLLISETTSVYANGQKSGNDKKGGGLARTTGNFIDSSLNWDDIAWLKKHSSKPIILKGVQSALDARKALAMGCAGIVVSK